MTYRDPQYLFEKFWTSLTNSSTIKRNKRILNISYDLSKWPHLHRAYVISGCIWLAVFGERPFLPLFTLKLDLFYGERPYLYWRFNVPMDAKVLKGFSESLNTIIDCKQPYFKRLTIVNYVMGFPPRHIMSPHFSHTLEKIKRLERKLAQTFHWDFL